MCLWYSERQHAIDTDRSVPCGLQASPPHSTRPRHRYRPVLAALEMFGSCSQHDVETLLARYIVALTGSNSTSVTATAVSVAGTIAYEASLPSEGWLMLSRSMHEAHVLMAINAPDNHRGWIDVGTIAADRWDTIVPTSNGLLVIPSTFEAVVGRRVADATLHLWEDLSPPNVYPTIGRSLEGAPGLTPITGYVAKQLPTGLCTIAKEAKPVPTSVASTSTTGPPAGPQPAFKSLSLQTLVIIVGAVLVGVLALGVGFGRAFCQQRPVIRQP
jgi:hypothetical protein